MGKRCLDSVLEELPRKKCFNYDNCHTISLEPGTILTDMSGKQWKLGKRIGIGGFGVIFSTSDDLSQDVTDNAQYICKIEDHSSGPLFVERNCYLRIAKLEMIQKWKLTNNIQSLGMPHYIASGSHKHKNNRYRFLIIPKYDCDLEQIFNAKGQRFNIKTVCKLSIQIIGILEYIHSNGYVHADIKASNLLLKKKSIIKSAPTATIQNVRYHGTVPLRTCRIRNLPQVKRCLRPNNYLKILDFSYSIKSDGKKLENDQVYLVDYGLATKYVHTNGSHKEYCTDERRAHAGTILFCSRDAHDGAQSRRSDLECLGYNIIYWLTGNLPWKDNVDDPEIVHGKKVKCMNNLKDFLIHSFNNDYPKFIYDYLMHLSELQFYEKPNYSYYKNLFKSTIIEYGYKNDNYFDFNNVQKSIKRLKKIGNIENINNVKATKKIIRTPLRSNMPGKPLLRKNCNKKQISWSKILIDPEDIIKQYKHKERKSPDIHEMSYGCNVHKFDLYSLNPTPAMIEVYNRYKQKNNNNGLSSMNKGDSDIVQIEGYTPAMMAVHIAKIERREQLYQQINAVNNSNKQSQKRGLKQQKIKKLKYLPIITRSITHNHRTRSEVQRKTSETDMDANPYKKIYRVRG